LSKPRRRLSAQERREVIERAAADVFAQRGYHGTTMAQIARASGVTVPVIYDHFPSKVALHRRLLERTSEELVAMWRTALAADVPADRRIAHALDAWASYVQTHPYAPRMYFTETTGDPEIRALHRQIQEQGLHALGAILAGDPDAARVAAGQDPLAFEMAAEVMRAGLTGLAAWWAEHPEVPRERIVETAINVLWTGIERLRPGPSR
jgi:AcrR family transcriptional regulator